MGGFAWVTLATNDSYSLGALVLAHSLRRVNTAHQLVIMITPGVSEAMRTQLSAVFNLVKLVDVLDSRDTANLTLLARPELGITFTKLHCWRLTQFDKCVFLDADTIVLQNSDELFEREELSAAPDIGWPDCFNSGVFVYKPSEETFKSITDFALVHGTFDGGDQGLLNLYFSDWATKDIKKHLPFIYNVVSSVTYTYLPALKQFKDKLKIIHFIGATKPWLQPFDSQTGMSRISGDIQSQSQGAYIQLWWDIFCAHVHPILSSEMAGLAGALSTITLGSPLSEEQHALQEHLRRQGWEEGHIDYMGRDSFDNIWRKICETLATRPASVPTSEPVPPQAAEPSPPKETKVETRRASIPQSERPVDTIIMTPKTVLEPTAETVLPTPPPLTKPPQFTPVPIAVPPATEVATPKPVEPVPPILPSEPAPTPSAPTEQKPTETSTPVPEPSTPPAPVPASSPSEPAVKPTEPPAPLPSELKPTEVNAPVPSEADSPPTPKPSEPEPVSSVQIPAETVPPTAPAPEPTTPAPPAAEPTPQPEAKPAEILPPAPQPETKPAEVAPPQPKPVETKPEVPTTMTKTETTPTSDKPTPPAEKPEAPPSPISPPTEQILAPPAAGSPTVPPSTVLTTPPQSPAGPQEPPKEAVASQPATPTVTGPTPPVSPPAVSSEMTMAPITVEEKLTAEVVIPQTPPISPPGQVPPPPAPSGATGGGDEPPIPPKRKGGKGAQQQQQQQQQQQGKGGKGGKGKK